MPDSDYVFELGLLFRKDVDHWVICDRFYVEGTNHQLRLSFDLKTLTSIDTDGHETTWKKA
jgi:hypothetical protein